MANINQLVRRKQNLRMALMVWGSVQWVGPPGICLPRSMRKSSADTATKSAAAQYDWCGSQTFDKKVSDAAVADIQHTAVRRKRS